MRAQRSFDYAIIRVVPRVDREEFINAGVILYCLAEDFLGARIGLDPARLRALAPKADFDDIESHLRAIPLICQGGPDAGPIGALAQKERWHWLVAPRSTVIQTSAVHSGICGQRTPQQALDRLFEEMVTPPR